MSEQRLGDGSRGQQPAMVRTGQAQAGVRALGCPGKGTALGWAWGASRGPRPLSKTHRHYRKLYVPSSGLSHAPPRPPAA